MERDVAQDAVFIREKGIEAFNKMCQAKFIEFFNALLDQMPVSKMIGFMKKHHIKMIEDEKHGFILKYQDLMVKFDQYWKICCRGLNLTVRDNKIDTIRFVFNKFVNYHECQSMYGCTAEQLMIWEEALGHKIDMKCKYDGSCIVVYNDTARTLGSNGSGKMQGDLRFGSYALKLLHVQYPEAEQWLHDHPECSMICEMETPFNVIVHKRDIGEGKLTPLAWIQSNEISRTFPFSLENQDSWKWCKDTSVSTFKTDAQVFVDYLNSLPENNLHQTPCEGVVFYSHNTPLFKFKTTEYREWHSSKGKTTVHPMSVAFKVQKAVFEKRVDDEPLHQEEAQKFLAQLDDFSKQAELYFNDMKRVLIQDGKPQLAHFFETRKIKNFMSSFLFSNFQNVQEHVKRNPDIELFDFLAFIMLSKKRFAKKMEDETFLQITIDKCGSDWITK
jgi:hypothetical protein